MIQEITTTNISIPNGTYLLIEAHGTINSLEEHKIHSENIAEQVLKTEYNKILLDEREVHYRLHLISVHEIVDFYISALPPEARLKQMALVSSEKNFKNATFWETVSYNRGFNFKVFHSYDDAVQWLLQKKQTHAD